MAPYCRKLCTSTYCLRRHALLGQFCVSSFYMNECHCPLFLRPTRYEALPPFSGVAKNILHHPLRITFDCKDIFKDKDVVFDFQEAESDNGACGWYGIWGICNKYRSTTSCPSKSQGVDAAEGQGHLCETAATKISKAFLMSIYSTGR